jgi:myo-inositol-1(or 4)-monophosphatase
VGDFVGFAVQGRSGLWVCGDADGAAEFLRLLGRGFGIKVSTDNTSGNHFFNLCARSLSVFQNPVPAKIRMLGVSTYSLLTIAMGAALGAVEATPKIWDISAVWAIVHAAGGTWKALDDQVIFPLVVGEDYGSRPYPTLVVARSALLEVFGPLVASIPDSAID